MRFVLLPGQRFDTVGVPPLIEGLAFDALIADKAFDSNAIIADLDARGAKVVISQHPRRAKPLAIDEEMYKWRHLIENFFGIQNPAAGNGIFGCRDGRLKIGLRDRKGHRRPKEWNDTGRKSPQKRPIGSRRRDLRFRRTGWWARQGSNL